MQYTRRSFSISSVSSKQNAPRGQYCAEKGHSGTDSRGCCYSCGVEIDPYVHLEGGPMDGYKLRASLIKPSGRTNLVPIDATRFAHYDMASVAGETPIRMTFREELP